MRALVLFKMGVWRLVAVSCLVASAFLTAASPAAAAPPQPDLTMKVTFINEDTILWEIFNNGAADVQAGVKVEGVLEWRRPNGAVTGNPATVGGGVLLVPLTPGASFGNFSNNDAQLAQWMAARPADAMGISCRADPNKTIAESNESNNGCTVKAPQPDLTMDVTFINEDTILWNINNIGAASVKAGIKVEGSLEWRKADGAITGNSITVGGGVLQIPLSPGGSFGNFSNNDAQLAQWMATRPANAIGIAYQADPNKSILESNEQNNSGYLAAPTPDLTMDLAFTDEDTFLYNVYNKGNGSIKAGTKVEVTFEWRTASGALTGNQAQVASVLLIPIAPGASFGNFSNNDAQLAQWMAARPADAAGILFRADPDNLIGESNEKNNYGAVKAPLPDLTMDLAFTDQDTFLYNVYNTGNASVKAGTKVEITFEWQTANGAKTGNPVKIASVLLMSIVPGSYFGNWSDNDPQLAQLVAARPGNAVKLVGFVDPGKLILESNEVNNYFIVNAPLL